MRGAYEDRFPYEEICCPYLVDGVLTNDVFPPARDFLWIGEVDVHRAPLARVLTALCVQVTLIGFVCCLITSVSVSVPSTRSPCRTSQKSKECLWGLQTPFSIQRRMS